MSLLHVADALRHWLAIHTGTVNESGPFYGFWSGFGSDIGEVTLIGALVAGWRHHNCHERGCPRLGHPVTAPDGSTFKVCHRHHPFHPRRHRRMERGALAHAVKGTHVAPES